MENLNVRLASHTAGHDETKLESKISDGSVSATVARRRWSKPSIKDYGHLTVSTNGLNIKHGDGVSNLS